MMRNALVAGRLDDAGIGEEIHALAAQIYPVCRSITGDGVRKTLDRLGEHIALTVHEVASGTQVFDWTVPREWNIRDAYIKNAAGERIVDFRASNLHVLNYSVPVHAKLPLAELKEHIFTLPDQPDAIPYRTSYYAERWGFCMAYNRLMELSDGLYEVLIDATLEDGSLNYGEYLHQGESDEEFLFSAHICHPSLANDNCSGLALLTHLAKRLARVRTRYTYRFLFAPGTIGAIAWLARNQQIAARIRHGLVVSCVGDEGGPTYKKSRRGDSVIDRAMMHVLRHTAPSPNILDFSPYGYDERQYCSPGFDLPVGLFQRSQFASFPQYHTSDDNLEFIKPEHLASSYRMICAALDVVENDCRPRNTMPMCEPQLGRRGLYSPVGGAKEGPESSMALLWVLNLADETNSLLDMAERAKMPFAVIAEAANRLRDSGLLVVPEEALALKNVARDERSVIARRRRWRSIGVER
jgi:aminopeptidase-like protein